MAYQCEQCSFQITRRNALCEDWRDEDRAFGCPGCGTFYRRRGRALNAGSIGGILGGGVGTPAMVLFGYGLQTDDKLVLALSALVMLSLLVILILTRGGFGVDYEPSGYQSAQNSGDKLSGDNSARAEAS